MSSPHDCRLCGSRFGRLECFVSSLLHLNRLQWMPESQSACLITLGSIPISIFSVVRRLPLRYPQYDVFRKICSENFRKSIIKECIHVQFEKTRRMSYLTASQDQSYRLSIGDPPLDGFWKICNRKFLKIENRRFSSSRARRDASNGVSNTLWGPILQSVGLVT